MAAYVYEHLDKDGRVLYVGMSEQIIRRTLAHETSADWYDQVAMIRLNRCEDKNEALYEERRLIKEHAPRFNNRSLEQAPDWVRYKHAETRDTELERVKKIIFESHSLGDIKKISDATGYSTATLTNIFGGSKENLGFKTVYALVKYADSLSKGEK